MCHRHRYHHGLRQQHHRRRGLRRPDVIVDGRNLSECEMHWKYKS